MLSSAGVGPTYNPMSSARIMDASKAAVSSRLHTTAPGNRATCSSNSGAGVCYTRTGRRFFEDLALEAQFLERIRAACAASGLWEELGTDWVVLDCELMPWSMKAQELLVEQSAPVGASARAGLSAAQTLLRQAAERGVDTGKSSASIDERLRVAQLYRDAYARYCWPVASLDDVKLAPFHLLASEGAVDRRQ